MPVFAISIVLAAFLFFWVQPLLGRFILPVFGGTASVWSACLLFFQLTMLGGYAYAHFLGRLKRLELQVVLHTLFCIGAAATLPFSISEVRSFDSAVMEVMSLLLGAAGLPCLALAGTSTLTQAWWARCRPDRSPYRLYALSNAGSLLGLVMSTWVFDSQLARVEQGRYWAAFFVVYGIAMLAVGTLAARGQSAAIGARERGNELSGPSMFLWLALPLCGSVLLLAFTARLTSQFAVVPFLWTLPLAVYLLSYILAFDHPRWYSRRFMSRALPVGLGAIWLVLFISRMPITRGFAIELVVSIPVLFICCLFCHGELHRLRPAADQLSKFYLFIAAGGALGGGLVSLIAPMIFDSYAELPLGLFLCGLLGFVIWRRENQQTINEPDSMRIRGYFCGGLVIYGLAWVAFFDSRQIGHVASARNFFGVCGVYERAVQSDANRHLVMFHGATIHGIQFSATNRQGDATAYYGPSSGLGSYLSGLTNRPPLKMGAIGLGTGTVATYGRAGDSILFHELNPLVIEQAQGYFTFLENSLADVSFVVGDARMTLARESPQDFDLLVVDAFNGGTIPVHLLTREAFELYAANLSPDGVIAVHVTNRHLDLAPVAAAAGRSLGFNGWRIFHRIGREAGRKTGTRSSDWVLMSRAADWFPPEHLSMEAKRISTLPRVPMWTDERSDLLAILK